MKLDKKTKEKIDAYFDTHTAEEVCDAMVKAGGIATERIYCESNVETMKRMPDGFVDMVVTSPPYDNMRTYGGQSEWNETLFREIVDQLKRVVRKGGVVVWIVGDAVFNGSETGTSFRQALYFMEKGFKLHDTMIYEKNSSSFPAARTSKRYTQIFEYMFVFSNGKIRSDISLIADKKNKWAGFTNWGKNTMYEKDGTIVETSDIKPVPEFSLRNNIWKYSVGFNDKTGHPAVFPEKLAEDHILSWSVEGDIVYDPFMGSGTTAKMAILNNRHYIGSEVSPEYCEMAEERLKKITENDKKKEK